VPREVEICPGSSSFSELASHLRTEKAGKVPIRANGSCVWTESVGGKVKHRESFGVKVWVEFPDNFLLQGDIALDPRGIVLGSNGSEYWLAIRPKAFNNYLWGHWDQLEDNDQLAINPRLLLGVFGDLDIDAESDWEFENEGAYDVLTKVAGDGELTKIHVFSCSKRIVRVEYGMQGVDPAVELELDKYFEVSEGFYVPRVLRILSRDGGEVENRFEIKLHTLKPTSLTEKQRDRLFSRPDVSGFGNITEDGVLIKNSN